MGGNGVGLWLDAIALFRDMPFMRDTFDRLESLIHQRRTADPASSYVAKLFEGGRAKIAQKVGEEATETVIAAMSDDREGLVGEAADLIFHLMILIADSDIALDDVLAELDRRDGLSGLVEKASRGP